ncbi:MAG: type II toxin-antitoxin system RelE/ParE family toxin [Candidatus Omnitrophica bacterium]|nr:type II toxin-antitoxin system RelE/ParE family toxin [Candidatus Omnitrophota bacterium]MCB9783219.1 type II toxin-antitoxin system RelE/ParE family toxin [Candidatus Omnitrophota bacterium]
MASVSKTEDAESDLLEIWGTIAQNNPLNADRFLEQIESHCENLAYSPRIGKLRSDLGTEIRSFPVGEYLLFYQPIDEGILLVRVIHGRRNYEALFQRESE